MRVGVVGASGYVGGEILRLLVSHPHAEITMVTSRQYVGEYISRVQPSLKGFTDLTFSELDYDKLTDKCDLVFTAVPHGTAVDIVKALYDRGMKVIDLSADYRLHNPADYDKWYGWQHPHPELLEKSVFGVPELHREEIKKSQLVSCPGCMAVTSILGLYPLIKKKIIDTEHIVVDSKIGSSGAGAGTVSGTHHAMRSGVIRPYKPAKHRHTGEIEQELSQAAGSKIKVSMSPHAVDIVRGILCTNHVFLKQPVSEMDLWKMYREQYQNERFIRLIRDKKGFYK
ncbi:MAG: N-acetyl-gamma-glutamyl-phosphate reductase, partial [Thaumarchaeota archaeon]|nr:N-acetyl-gamma-glutamyl-phosphate reductase [Nitrososphaerota archaeon]